MERAAGHARGENGETPLSNGVSVDYDLIVVGGGLAGSSLAIAPVGRGIRMLVVERQESSESASASRLLSDAVTNIARNR
ncbi:FAD-binding protein [Mesorhizobium sp. B1-1-5]|nr:FAD-binding protein [Mesorhizobium sp. B1-1-5]